MELALHNTNTNANLQHARHNCHLLSVIYFPREESAYSRWQCVAFELSLLYSYHHSVRGEGSPRYLTAVMFTVRKQMYRLILGLKYYHRITPSEYSKYRKL
jgi:hypothetical protein